MALTVKNFGRVAAVRFFDAATGGYSPCQGAVCHNTSALGSQTSNSMALQINAPPDATTASAVAAALSRDVGSFGNRTTAGVSGLTTLFTALDKAGHSSEALAILLGDAYPSIGHMVRQNMTTLCEDWACAAHSAGGGSQNHIMCVLRRWTGSFHQLWRQSINCSLCLTIRLRLVQPACRSQRWH